MSEDRFSEKVNAHAAEARRQMASGAGGRFPAGWAGLCHFDDGGAANASSYPVENPFDAASESGLFEQFRLNFAHQFEKRQRDQAVFRAKHCGTTHAARVAAAMED